jgi:hypothetical protein
VPLPVNTEKFKYEPNRKNGKIRIFHGINRKGFKGSQLIESALNEIQKKYPDKVEIIIKGHIPFLEYYQFLKTVNIVVDQVYGFELGMNALISMANGRIVFAGYDLPGNNELLSIPIERFNGNKETLVAKLEQYIEKPYLLEVKGWASREYVEKYHNYITVAGKFIEVWNR